MQLHLDEIAARVADEPVYVVAEDGEDHRCSPEAAFIVDMHRNEAELDIDIGHCRAPPAAMTAGVSSAR
jgi:hypothetical protein